MQAKLKVVSGLAPKQTVQLGPKLLIGRAGDCDLRLESDFVSNYHCILLLDEYTLRLRDLGSKNGTFVNGRRVGTSAIILLQDDNVCIGEVNLLIELKTEAPEPIHSAPEVESSSPQSAVFLPGNRVRADAEIGPPTVSKLGLPNALPQASDPVPPPQRQEEDGNA
ncbi:MAG TPA: FHA domain-containing protein [Planctomycetaceae bacterium]|nr:FHA domain-containing protein [Planctomycetaceae bacterium]